MKWHVTAKERADAIEWLLGLADLQLRGLRNPQAGEMSESNLLAGAAFYSERIANEDAFSMYLEAAALLHDGWVPGGEP